MRCCAVSNVAPTRPAAENDGQMQILTPGKPKQREDERPKTNDSYKKYKFQIESKARPSKGARPSSAQRKNQARRPDSANGVSAPKFTKEELEELWINNRVCYLKRYLNDLGESLSDSYVRAIAKADCQKIVVYRNIFSLQQTERSSFDESGESDGIKGYEIDGEAAQRFLQTPTGEKPEDFAMANFLYQAREIQSIDVMRSDDEKQVAELLGISEEKPIEKYQEKPSKAEEALVLGEIVIE